MTRVFFGYIPLILRLIVTNHILLMSGMYLPVVIFASGGRNMNPILKILIRGTVCLWLNIHTTNIYVTLELYVTPTVWYQTLL